MFKNCKVVRRPTPLDVEVAYGWDQRVAALRRGFADHSVAQFARGPLEFAESRTSVSEIHLFTLIIFICLP